MNKKILSLEQLCKKINILKKRKKIVVHCHGVFDLLHLGHIRHFEEAKKNGDILIVTVTSNKFVNKGPNRPMFNANQRLEALSALHFVDFVAENDSSDAIKLIKFLKPNIYCKGPDYKKSNNDLSQKIQLEEKAIKSVKGKIIYTKSDTFSSSSIINDYINFYDKDQSTFLKQLKKNIKFSYINQNINKCKKNKVLLIGEAIIDQYVFCESQGKSGKEPVLTMRILKTEEYLGGILAIAKHISEFVHSITIVTMLGQNNKYFQYIKKRMPSNVKIIHINKKNSPTILKTRYIESLNKRKLLGIYDINDTLLDSNDEKKFQKLIIQHSKSKDLIITCDYGHGLISSSSSKLICKLSKFKTLNAQINSSNLHYYSLEKYNNVDLIVINESEIRYHLRNRESKTEVLIKNLSKIIKAKTIVVTRGAIGAILYDTKTRKFHNVPAFASKIVDKIGSGDALFAILSVMLKNRIDINVSLFLSSLIAGDNVENINNSYFTTKNSILKKINHMMK